MKGTEKRERPNPKYRSPVSFPPKGGRGVAGSVPDPDPIGGIGVSPGISEPDPPGGMGGMPVPDPPGGIVGGKGGISDPPIS